MVLAVLGFTAQNSIAREKPIIGMDCNSLRIEWRQSEKYMELIEKKEYKEFHKSMGAEFNTLMMYGKPIFNNRYSAFRMALGNLMKPKSIKFAADFAEGWRNDAKMELEKMGVNTTSGFERVSCE